MIVKILPNDKGTPAGKLADAEIQFTEGEPLAELRLLGFAVWERRGGSGRNVVFPARSYTVNGERRSFALLRPGFGDDAAAGETRVRELVLKAYAEYEESAREAV